MSGVENSSLSWQVLGPGDPWLHEYYKQYRPAVFAEESRPLKLLVLLGSADISGGSYVIFQHAHYWQRHGADVTIATLMPRAALLSHWHPALDELTITTIDDLGDEVYDVTVATWWRTVYELPEIRTRHALYFVQSIESRFYVDGDDTYAAPLAELTYRYDLPVVTIASGSRRTLPSSTAGRHSWYATASTRTGTRHSGRRSSRADPDDCGYSSKVSPRSP